MHEQEVGKRFGLVGSKGKLYVFAAAGGNY